MTVEEAFLEETTGLTAGTAEFLADYAARIYRRDLKSLTEEIDVATLPLELQLRIALMDDEIERYQRALVHAGRELERVFMVVERALDGDVMDSSGT